MTAAQDGLSGHGMKSLGSARAASCQLAFPDSAKYAQLPHGVMGSCRYRFNILTQRCVSADFRRKRADLSATESGGNEGRGRQLSAEGAHGSAARRRRECADLKRVDRVGGAIPRGETPQARNSSSPGGRCSSVRR